MFGASSELASVMEFGFNTSLLKAKFHYTIVGSELVRSWLEAGSNQIA